MTTSPILKNARDMDDLRAAAALLEAPSLTIRLADLVGSPIEWALAKLPDGAQSKIQGAVNVALQKAVSAALWTMSDEAPGGDAYPKVHSALAAVSGAVGGFFGMAGTLVELPISTTVMMRSVADIARSEGFSVSEPAVQAECIQVFAMGGKSKDDDAADSAYYALRTALNEAAGFAGKVLAEAAAAQAAASSATRAFKASPKEVGTLLAKIIQVVASRFGITITEKVALQAVPVIGSISGAAINTLFINHYQDMARGHFTVKRLEAKYGAGPVRAAYRKVLSPKTSSK